MAKPKNFYFHFRIVITLQSKFTGKGEGLHFVHVGSCLSGLQRVSGQALVAAFEEDMRTVNWKALLEGVSDYSNDEIRAAVEGGANIEIARRDGWTALMMFAWEGNSEMVRLLVDHRADVNRTCGGPRAMDAVSSAFARYHIDCAAILFRAGASIALYDTFQFGQRDVMARIYHRLRSCRRTTAALLSRRFRRDCGLPADLARLIASQVWSGREKNVER